MQVSEKAYLIALTCIKEIGPVTQRTLLAHFGSAKAIFDASLTELIAIEGIGRKRAEAIKQFNLWEKIESIITRELAGEFKIICITEPEYPPLLKEIPDPPIVLYIKGNLLPEDKFSVAIVGPRKPTEYGLRVTNIFARGLAQKGITVVSGLARGIDTEAHKTAIVYGGRTIAVLGSGIDIVYPPENKGLTKRIQQQGAVVTEFLPGTRPERSNFPIRNRIISGLSIAVLIVEAPEDSGALITANYALDYSRDVFAVPGLITSSSSKGVHRLIKQGATLVDSPEEVIELLSPQLKGIKHNTSNSVEITLSEDEKLIISSIGSEPIHVDELTRQVRLPLNKVMALLTELELKGLIQQLPGKRFQVI